jgi:hypothetical protein
MQEELLGLLAAHMGHFRSESGHHGDLWLELDALFVRPGRRDRFVKELARRLSAQPAQTGPIRRPTLPRVWARCRGDGGATGT